MADVKQIIHENMEEAHKLGEAHGYRTIMLEAAMNLFRVVGPTETVKWLETLAADYRGNKAETEQHDSESN